MLAQGKHHAQHAGNRSRRQQQAAPPHRRMRQQRADTDKTVNADFNEHAGHQRRNVTRRHRVRARQPHVQRHNTGLETETDHRQQEDGRGRPRHHRRVRQRRQRERARHASHDGKQREQEERGRVRGDQIDPAHLAHRGVLVFSGDQEKRAERHNLPHNEKQNRVGGDRYSRQGRRGQAVKQAQPLAVVRMFRLLPITQPVNAAESRHQKNRQQEDDRESVHLDDPACDGRLPQGSQGAGNAQDRTHQRQHDGELLSRVPVAFEK